MRESMAQQVETALHSDSLRCPLCSSVLKVEPSLSRPHWYCAQGHSYSNIKVLVAELGERGWLPYQDGESATAGDDAVGAAKPDR